MSKWLEITDKFLDLLKKRPTLAFLALAMLILGIGCYAYFANNRKDGARITPQVQSTGSGNQNAGQNDGTMIQTNK